MQCSITRNTGCAALHNRRSVTDLELHFPNEFVVLEKLPEPAAALPFRLPDPSVRDIWGHRPPNRVAAAQSNVIARDDAPYPARSSGCVARAFNSSIAAALASWAGAWLCDMAARTIAPSFRISNWRAIPGGS